MPSSIESSAVWRAIAQHPMPTDANGRSFAKQLMREHKIKSKTADRAILEYKRFIYLVATSGGERRVPSKAVDHVWHHHMQHSRDYWNVFCTQIGQPIHHSPGGEGAAHLADYKATIQAYVANFDETPPKGIWRDFGWFGAVLFGVVGAVFCVVGLLEFSRGARIGILFAAIGVAALVFGLFGLSSRGRGYFIFEASGEWGDSDGGDCGSGCGGD